MPWIFRRLGAQKARARSGSKATKAGWLHFERAIGKDIFSHNFFLVAISNRGGLGVLP